MHLKRIELEGFKSFADRTVIQVQRGLTGIVGPNGCGKSNVVDALLWVMGERSAKTLRADSMDDVIFKGAEGRTGTPYAMVEIILSDEEGQVAEPGAEVAVGRRLFRTGESEYLLDGRKAKRKDVKDLLMNTGLGVRSYMVLAQGKIDAVLSANPAERRSVFEEAAGISRYKARKHEAELKLARVAQDLARVEDVYKEVQRAVRTLKYQAGKAQRFMEARDNYREAHVRLSYVDRYRMQVEETALKAQEKELETSIQEIRDRRSHMESRLNQLQEEADTLRQRTDSLRTDSSESRHKTATLEERVRGLDSRVGELENRTQRESERLAGLDEEDRSRVDADGLLQNENAQLAQKTAAIQSSLELADTEFSRIRDAHRATRQQMEELRAGVLKALGERSAQNNQVAEAAHKRSEAQGDLRSFERRQAELQSTKTEASEKLVIAKKEFREASLAAEQAEGRSHQLLQNRDSLRKQTSDAADAYSAAIRSQTEAQTRLTALEAVEQDMQGLPDSVRTTLEKGATGLRGLALDGIEIPAPWDRLLENLLGRLQHALWLDHRDAASQMKGAADCFFPAPRPTSPVHVAGARPLEDLFVGDSEKCRAICARLGEVYCVATAKEARRLADQHPGALFLSECGEMHGAGYARLGMLGDGAEGLLARTNLRQESEKALKKAQEAASSAQHEEGEARQQLENLNEELATLDSTLRKVVAERDRAQTQVEELERRELANLEELKAMEADFSSASELVEAANQVEAEATQLREAAERKRCELNEQLLSAETLSTEQEE
ncbi:MAG TPA: AAA family ATPase, partial [Planctomycetota bacterium]|nr:AAA family ATPase [Planctomycetota bacterium]